jgi:hypothetical protein
MDASRTDLTTNSVSECMLDLSVSTLTPQVSSGITGIFLTRRVLEAVDFSVFE